MKVQLNSFHLNGHTLVFHPQTSKLQPHLLTQGSTLVVKGLRLWMAFLGLTRLVSGCVSIFFSPSSILFSIVGISRSIVESSLILYNLLRWEEDKTTLGTEARSGVVLSPPQISLNKLFKMAARQFLRKNRGTLHSIIKRLQQCDIHVALIQVVKMHVIRAYYSTNCHDAHTWPCVSGNVWTFFVGFVFLICSFFLVWKHLPVSPI